jgi:hypothetical protein
VVAHSPLGQTGAYSSSSSTPSDKPLLFLAGEQPRRIAHQDSTRTFGLVTIVEEAAGWSDHKKANALRLLDSQTFETLHRFEMDVNEVPTA